MITKVSGSSYAPCTVCWKNVTGCQAVSALFRAKGARSTATMQENCNVDMQITPANAFTTVAQDKSCLEDPYVKSLLKKWDLHGKLQIHTFYYNKFYHKLQGPELISDLVNDQGFQQQFQVLTKSGRWTQLQGSISNIRVRPVPATHTRLDMFDRLLEADPPIVRRTGDGDIIKCMEDQREGFQVSDMLRQLLLCEESEHAELYSSDEKQTLLWRLFELVCLGGACCQFEDQLQPYLEVTKRLYKALLSVQKSATTGKVEVASTVLEVAGWDCTAGVMPFPCESRNNLFLVVIDPLKHLVKVLYHAFVPYW